MALWGKEDLVGNKGTVAINLSTGVVTGSGTTFSTSGYAAAKIIKDAVAKIPENEELGEKMVEICLVILGKAVKLTKTEMDDQLLEVVTKAIKARDEE